MEPPEEEKKLIRLGKSIVDGSEKIYKRDMEDEPMGGIGRWIFDKENSKFEIYEHRLFQ